jgi:hypothetical protein
MAVTSAHFFMELSTHGVDNSISQHSTPPLCASLHNFSHCLSRPERFSFFATQNRELSTFSDEISMNITYPQKMWITFPQFPQRVFWCKLSTKNVDNFSTVSTFFSAAPLCLIRSLWKTGSVFPQALPKKYLSCGRLENLKSYPQKMWITYPHFPQDKKSENGISVRSAGSLDFFTVQKR